MMLVQCISDGKELTKISSRCLKTLQRPKFFTSFSLSYSFFTAFFTCISSIMDAICFKQYV
jgi:hypothetical protein